MGKVEKLQAAAYQAFATAYLDSSSEKLLTEIFRPAVSSFSEAATLGENMADRALKLIPDQVLLSSATLPCPVALPKDPPKWDANRRVWKFGEQDGFYFHTRVRNPEFAKLLGFWPYELDTLSLAFYGANELKEGSFIDQKYVDEKIAEAKKWSGRYGKPLSVVPPISTGKHYCMQAVPNWWKNKNKDDADVFFTRSDGTPFPKRYEQLFPGTTIVGLNYWNGKVQQLQQEHHEAVGAGLRKYDDIFNYPFVFFGGEGYHSLPDGQEPGHNPSAISAFQAMLAEKYRDIKSLNSQWQSSYDSFQAIVPPIQRSQPGPLQYEFQRFKNASYFDKFLLPSVAALKKGYGSELTTAFDRKYTFGADFDVPRLTEAFDIALFRSYENWDKRIYPRWLSNLAGAAKTSWGTEEWTLSQGSEVMFELDAIKRHGIRSKIIETMWGASTPDVFMMNGWNGPSDYQYGPTFSDARLGYLVYHYHAPFVSIAIDRSQRFGLPALLYPTVDPDVVMIECESSFYNAYPAKAMRELMKNVSIRLEKDGWNYGTYYEKFLLEKKQSLEGVQTVIVPNGTCMGEGLNRMLESWVRNGGTLIAFAPTGVLNDLGLPANKGVVQSAFPGKPWDFASDQWKPTDEPPISSNGKLNLYRASLGKGTVYVFSSAIEWPPAENKTTEILEKHTRRTIGSPNHNLELCMRESADAYYLYVLNWSLTDPVESEIFFTGQCVSLSDEGLQRPMKVPFDSQGNVHTFRVSLQPAESTLFKITKKKSVTEQ